MVDSFTYCQSPGPANTPLRALRPSSPFSSHDSDVSFSSPWPADLCVWENERHPVTPELLSESHVITRCGSGPSCTNTAARAGVGEGRGLELAFLVGHSGPRFGGEAAGPAGHPEVGLPTSHLPVGRPSLPPSLPQPLTPPPPSTWAGSKAGEAPEKAADGNT